MHPHHRERRVGAWLGDGPGPSMGPMRCRQRRSIEVTDREQLRSSFDRRPATWLRPFLQLAVVHVAPGADPWYRLGPPASDGHARLVWHPHGAPGPFERFSGSLAVDTTPGDSWVTLEGEVTGGDASADIVLGNLVEFLVDAFEADQRSG